MHGIKGDLQNRIEDLNKRVKKIEGITIPELETKIYVVLNDHSEEIEALKNRPISNGEGPAIDMSQFCSSDDFFNLL